MVLQRFAADDGGVKVRQVTAAAITDPHDQVVIVALVSDVDGYTEYRLDTRDGARLRRVDAFEDPETGKLFRRIPK